MSATVVLGRSVLQLAASPSRVAIGAKREGPGTPLLLAVSIR